MPDRVNSEPTTAAMFLSRSRAVCKGAAAFHSNCQIANLLWKKQLGIV